MMNIRDYIFINKAKTSNKIRILEILGFQTDNYISQSPNLIKEIDRSSITDEIDSFKINEQLIEDKIEINKVDPNLYNYEDEDKNNDTSTSTSTSIFEPVKITSQIKKIWIDIESRRKWVVPITLIISTFILLSITINIFIDNKNNQEEIENLYASLTKETNELITILPNIILISTDEFYSKYDVSNASADLQLIESTIMEYERNLNNRADFVINDDLDKNLDLIFSLINNLDNVITYRILNSEMLIYNDLLENDNYLDIDILSSSLSEISAVSKLNYANLPNIDEFDKHVKLLDETLNSAEDLHGRLIASLRNNENEVAKSLIVAIKMNKEIEQNSFIAALDTFKNNKLKNYNNISLLP